MTTNTVKQQSRAGEGGGKGVRMKMKIKLEERLAFLINTRTVLSCKMMEKTSLQWWRRYAKVKEMGIPCNVLCVPLTRRKRRNGAAA